MNKKSILFEAPQNVPNNTYLSGCLTTYAVSLKSLLNEYSIVAVGAQKEIILDLNAYLDGVATWLRHLIFNRGRKIPNHLKHTSLKRYEPFARRSECLLKLAEGVCDASDIFMKYKPDNVDEADLPAYIWFLCEIGFLYAEIENSGLGASLGIPDLTNPGKPATKDASVRFFRQVADFLDGEILETDITATEPERWIPYLRTCEVLLAKGRELAKINDDFGDVYLQPYIKASRRLTNIIRKNPTYKIRFLLPDGSIVYTAKDHKKFKGFGRL
jgi:hypothetical protein